MSILKVMGVSETNIGKVEGVSKASIEKIDGVEFASAAETVIEGFEANPFTGLTLNWLDGGGSSTITRTSSHVTQGSFTWRIQDVDNFGGVNSDGSYDLTAYSTIYIDVFIASIDVGGTVEFGVMDGLGGGGSDTTSAGTTGAVTLEFDLNSLSLDKSISFISLLCFSDTGFDIYIDNLRVV